MTLIKIKIRSKIILLDIYLCNWRICVRIKSRVASSGPGPILWIIGKSQFFLNLEKRNHVNKNIPSLREKNDNEMVDSLKILDLQRQFYQDLFSSKETTPLRNSKYSEKLFHLPKMIDSEKYRLDAPYIIEELVIFIQKSKLNKAPGPDGYSNEFFYFFLNELKFWIYRYLTEAIEN